MNRLFGWWWNTSLGGKVVIFSSLLVLAAVAVLTLVSIEREQSSFHAQLEAQADLLLEALALNMRDPLYKLQVSEMDEMVKIVGDNKSITQLSVYDSKGFLLVDSDQELPIAALSPDPVGARLVNSESGQMMHEWQTGRLLAGRPVTIGNQNVGAVAVGLSTQPLDERVATLTFQSVLIALIIIAVGLGLAIILTRQVTRPLEGLTQAAAQMAEGKHDTHVEVQSKDEVGQLAAAFNQMADRVKQRETDLKDLAAGLDQMVKQRTAQLEQQNNDLTLARKQAEEATQIKSQFLATISHELRTPLNSIMGFSQLLLLGAAGDLNEKQADRIERILKSGQELLSLINDLLDLSRIEAGRAEIIRKPFAVKTWAHEITHQLESLAQQKSLAFESSVDPGLPETLIGDPDRLRQVAVNLLGNAIKFTERGKVSFRIEKQSVDSWVMIVSDTGIGIAPHAQKFIFDEFRQVDSSPQREYGGTGLGLSIVRNLVVLMGGEVSVHSKVGEGSVFTAQFPLLTEAVSQV